MRTVLVLACAVAFLFSAWSNMPTTAAKWTGNTTISPVDMMATTTKLPTEQFDAF